MLFDKFATLNAVFYAIDFDWCERVKSITINRSNHRFGETLYHLHQSHLSALKCTFIGCPKKKCLLPFSAASIQPTLEIFFCNRNNRQSTIFEQNLETFGQCQNCQNLTFKWPYELYN